MGALPAAGLGHIESNDCPDCEFGAAGGAAAGCAGAVGGGQTDWEGCAACWAGVAYVRGEIFLRVAVFFAGMRRSLASEDMGNRSARSVPASTGRIAR